MGGEEREEAQERRGGRAMAARSKEEKEKEEGRREKSGERHTTQSRGGGQECLGPRCGPHRFPDSPAAGSQLMELGQAARKLSPSHSSFLSLPGVSFQQTLRNLGSVGQETLGALG